MSDSFHEAIAQEVVWKNDEVRRFAVALVAKALETCRMGEDCTFTTDIVPDELRGDGPGIAGSVVELLKNAHVIEPVGITQAGEWYPKRLKSTRPGCKSRYLCVHRLVSVGVARAFLKRNAEGRMQNAETVGELRQAELV